MDGPPPRRGPMALLPRRRPRVAASPPSPGLSPVDVGGKRPGEQVTIQVAGPPLAPVRASCERHLVGAQQAPDCPRRPQTQGARRMLSPSPGHPPIDRTPSASQPARSPCSGAGYDRAAAGVADQDNQSGPRVVPRRRPPGRRGVAAPSGGGAGWRNRWRRTPRSRRARIDSPKPVASAHAPWTNTMVGVSAGIVVTIPSLLMVWRLSPPTVVVCRNRWTPGVSDPLRFRT